MNFWSFDTLPQWAMLIDLGMHLAFGLGGGALYVSAVRRSAQLLAGGGNWGQVIAPTAARLLLAGGAFVLASREGAGPLLALALGFMLARLFVMRRGERG